MRQNGFSYLLREKFHPSGRWQWSEYLESYARILHVVDLLLAWSRLCSSLVTPSQSTRSTDFSVLYFWLPASFMETLILPYFSAEGKLLSGSCCKSVLLGQGFRVHRGKSGFLRRQLPLPSSWRPRQSGKTIKMRITANMVAMWKPLIHKEL